MSNTVLESVVGGEVALDVSRVQEELLSAVDGPLIDELVGRARREGLELSGPNGLLAALTKRVLEAALEGEIRYAGNASNSGWIGCYGCRQGSLSSPRRFRHRAAAGAGRS